MQTKYPELSRFIGRLVLGSLWISSASAVEMPSRGGDGSPALLRIGACMESEANLPAAGCWEIPDRDGDGVPADRDRCPDTPPGVTVDAQGCPADTDRDGVADVLDRCPDTAYGVRVDINGCPLDLDGDGVPEGRDRCPTTPPGVEVDADGCTVKLVLEDIAFAFNQAELTGAAQARLSQLIHSLAYETDVMGLRITGHTDNIGSAEYNQQLSEMRARVVLHYLQTHHAAWPLASFGVGDSQPLASNKTAAGRARNRRVEIEVERAPAPTKSATDG